VLVAEGDLSTVTNQEDGAIEQPHFVWVISPRGPQPQIWTELYWGLHDLRKAQVLAFHLITEQEAKMSFKELALKYPPPAHGITIHEQERGD